MNCRQKNDKRRNTLNLMMVENGWAAFFPIYPSLPKDKNDLIKLALAAEAAWKNRRGMWRKFGKNLLLLYEFRSCIKLAQARTANQGVAKAFPRKCIDIRTMKLMGLFDYHLIEPCYRMWVWKKDVRKAVADLSLKT